MSELTRRTFMQPAGALVVSAALPSFGVAQRGDGRTAYRFFIDPEYPDCLWHWTRLAVVTGCPTYRNHSASSKLF